MSFKMLQKERVLTSGTGSDRVVLDFDSGLIYKYQNPEHITGVFENGRWIVVQNARYSTGGWGSGASGDRDGHYAHQNTVNLIRAIGAQAFEANISDLSDLGRINKMIQHAAKVKSLKAAAEKLGLEPGGLSDFEENGLKITSNFRTRELPKGRGTDVFKTLDKMKEALEVFTGAKGRAVKVDTYTVYPNLIQQGKTVVAFRDGNGKVFMNSQVLHLSNFENSFLGSESMIQNEVKKLASYSIPFNVLEAASLKISETKILEQGPEETFEIKVPKKYGGTEMQSRHFTGALLLENSGRKFLMDLDRIEIAHKLFNVFFVEVSSSVTSIAEAYESMKPDEVKQAEANGIEVRRQGEWFFVATDKTITIDVESQLETYQRREDDEGANLAYIASGQVSHGKGRPNDLYKPFNFGADLDSLVCGVVTHRGREHAPLSLDQIDEDGHIVKIQENDMSRYRRNQSIKTCTLRLWKLVPNTTVSNFTIQGDVD